MLFRRALIFAALLLPFALLADEKPNPYARWEKAIAGLEASDREKAPAKGSIVFVGSSSIRRWTTLTQDFPNLPVINHGFGGSQLADSTYFAERIIFPCEPRQVILYAGSNDINARKTAAEVFADFKAFAEKIRSRLPETEIAYISIAGNPARWAQVETIRAANAAIEAYIREQPGMKFIDVFPHMLGPDGLPKPDIFVEDGLHMNAKGYAIWTEVVRPYLSK